MRKHEPTIMFPKPQYKKQRIKKEPAIFIQGECFNCGSTHRIQTHHIYGAANRPLSERYGLYVSLCLECHISVTENKNMKLVKKLKQEGQRRFEKRHSREEFKKIFKRNYL